MHAARYFNVVNLAHNKLDQNSVQEMSLQLVNHGLFHWPLRFVLLPVLHLWQSWRKASLLPVLAPGSCFRRKFRSVVTPIDGLVLVLGWARRDRDGIRDTAYIPSARPQLPSSSTQICKEGVSGTSTQVRNFTNRSKSARIDPEGREEH